MRGGRRERARDRQTGAWRALARRSTAERRTDTDAVAFRNSFRPTVATFSAVVLKSTQRVVPVVARYSSIIRRPMLRPIFFSCSLTSCTFSRSATSCRTMPPYSAPSTSEGIACCCSVVVVLIMNPSVESV